MFSGLPPFPIDTRSLMVASALILGSSCVAFLVLRRMRTTLPGPSWWAACNGVGFLGMMLLAGRNILPGALSITLANGLLLLGFCCNFAGLRLFLGRGLPHASLWLLPFLEMGAVHWYFAMDPSHTARLVFSSLLIGGISLGMALELVRHGRRGPGGGLLPAQNFTRWVIALYGLLFIVRGFAGLFLPVPDSALDSHPLTTGAYLAAIVLAFLNTLGLFLMCSERLQHELARQASHDHLTGIPNRRAFHLVARHEIGRAKRTFEPLALLMIDLDRFKTVNDRFGHAAGDAVLRDFASLLAASVREQDLVCRYGGEEFVVLLPGTTLAGAETLAERIRLLAASRPIEHHGRAVAYTISVGVALNEPGDESIDALLDRADRALYRAKLAGRNRVSAEAGEMAWSAGAGAGAGAESLPEPEAGKTPCGEEVA